MLTLFSTKKPISHHYGHKALFHYFFPKVNSAFQKWTKKMSKIEKTKWTFKIFKNPGFLLKIKFVLMFLYCYFILM